MYRMPVFIVGIICFCLLIVEQTELVNIGFVWFSMSWHSMWNSMHLFQRDD